jgi:hypothetical protein
MNNVLLCLQTLQYNYLFYDIVTSINFIESTYVAFVDISIILNDSMDKYNMHNAQCAQDKMRK